MARTITDLVRSGNNPRRQDVTAEQVMDRLAIWNTSTSRAVRRLMRAWIRALRKARRWDWRHAKAQRDLMDLSWRYETEREAHVERLENWKAEAARLRKELADH